MLFSSYFNDVTFDNAFADENLVYRGTGFNIETYTLKCLTSVATKGIIDDSSSFKSLVKA